MKNFSTLLRQTFLSLLLIVLSLYSLIVTELSHAQPVTTTLSQSKVQDKNTLSSLPYFTLKQRITQKLIQPTALDIDSAGQVYILNGDNRVHVFSASGVWLFAFNTHSRNPQQQKSLLDGAMDLVIFNDEVYIADSKNHRIAIFTRQGEFTREITTQFPHQDAAIPVSLAVNKSSISFTDRKHHRVCQLSRNQRPPKSTLTDKPISQPSASLISCFGERGAKKSQFNFPYQVIKDQRGFHYVVDVLNARVQKFNRFGKNPLVFSQFGLADGDLFRPNGLALDDQQRLYVGDAYLGDISVFKQGKFLGLAQGIKPFNAVNSLRFKYGHLWVVDYRDNAVYQYQLRDNNQQHLNETTSVKKRQQYIQVKQHQQLSQKECVSCHLSWQVNISSDISKIAKNTVLPVASQKMCDSCHHGAVIDSRKAIRGYQHTSILDHDMTPIKEASTAIDHRKREDEIPNHFPLTQGNKLSCGSCHTPHNASKNKYSLYQEHTNNWLRIDNMSQEICLSCHKSQAQGANVRSTTATSINNNNQHTIARHNSHSQLLSTGQNHPIKVLLADITTQPKALQGELIQTSITTLQQGLPQTLRHHGASVDAQQQLECQSCHQIHGGFTKDLLTQKSKANQLCESCHQQQSAKNTKQAREKGIHPVNISFDEPREFGDKAIHSLTCQTCHSAHNGSSNTALLVNSVKNAEAQCVACHQQQNSTDIEHAKKHNIHPVNIDVAYADNMTSEDKIITNNQVVNYIGCLTCHSVHQGKANTAALVAPIDNGELCQHCHQSEVAVINSDHDLRHSAQAAKNALGHNSLNSGVCGSCHTMHQGKKGELALSAIPQPTSNQYNHQEHQANDMLCLNCHQENMAGKNKRLARFSHPKKTMILRSNKHQMPLLNKQSEVSEFGEIACKTCHDVHNWQVQPFDQLSQPQKQLIFNEKAKNIEGDSHNSFLRNQGVKGTFCVDCHREETLFKYRYYHETRSEQQGVDYIE